MTLEVAVDVSIPQGYLEMPLDDIDRTMENARELIRGATPPEFSATADLVLPVAELLMATLVERGARYCGIGRHASPQDPSALVISWLVVAVYETGGDTENPRLVIKSLAEAKARDGERGEIVVTDLDGRPVMLFERVADLPAPDLPAVEYDGDTAPVFQLQAVVPSPDGSFVAAVELSTTSTDVGPWFRGMIIDMARSVEFRAATHQGVLNL